VAQHESYIHGIKIMMMKYKLQMAVAITLVVVGVVLLIMWIIGLSNQLN
jgi:hypothetical protein